MRYYYASMRPPQNAGEDESRSRQWFTAEIASMRPPQNAGEDSSRDCVHLAHVGPLQ